VLLCASYKTTVEIYNLYWIYYANRGYLTVKVAMSVVRDSGKFAGHPYVRRIARSSLRQLSFLVYHAMLRRARLCHSDASLVPSCGYAHDPIPISP